MIILHTLGDSLIKVGNREVRPASSLMYAALLYLGVERGQRVPRAALQELLFGDAGERSGAHSLRQLLYKLRQLGAPIKAKGDVLWIEPEDVEDAAPLAATNGNGVGNAAYFSPGFSPRFSAAFDEWLERKRSEALAGQRRHLVSAMAARRDAADWDALESIARQLLSADPFNEEATFALAEATALAGSKAEAIRILERYEYETGRDDLKLNASVLRRRISEKLPDRRRLARDTPFLGRDAEMSTMRHAIGQLRQGLPGCVVIVGEPGIGKTRLLDEASALALLEGVNVQTVRCQPHYVNRPMGIFIELVPQLLTCRGALGVAPEMMEHLQLLVRHQDDRKHRPVDARDDATRSGILLAAVRDLVDAVSAEAPLLVAVEDAHWSDATSLQELTSLVRVVANRPLLVVYTTRMLEPLKQANMLSDAVQVLRLKPLVDDAMQALARHLLPAGGREAGDPNLAGWCANTAGGNPLYLQTLCTHYEDTREPFKVPPSMRAALTRRIEQLPNDCRRILEFSALLGKHATLEALRSLAELLALKFLKAVQRLEDDGLLRTRDGAARLSHDLLADCVLDLVPPLSRQVLHSCIASNLEERFDKSRDASLLWDCAQHRADSGDSSRALRFLVECARHLADLGRATHALELLHRAETFACTPADQDLVLMEQATAAKASGQWKVALSATQRIAERLGVVDTPDSEWGFRLIEAQWSTRFHSGTSISKLQERASLATLSVADRAEAALLLLRIFHERCDAQGARSAFEAVAPHLDPGARDYAQRFVPIIYHTSFGDAELAATLVDRLLEDLHYLPISSELRGARNLGVAFSLLGRPRDALAISERYFAKAQQLALPQWQYDFANSCCIAQLNLEDTTEAQRWFTIADSFREGANVVDYTHAVSGVELALRLNDPKRAADALTFLNGLPLGESARARSAGLAARLRVAQMDPAFLCAPTELEILRDYLESHTNHDGSDMIATAVIEEMRRRGLDPRPLVNRYVTRGRRELQPPPPEVLREADVSEETTGAAPDVATS